MRSFIATVFLIVTLAACNMTMAGPSKDGTENQVTALSTNTAVTAPPAATQVIAPTNTVPAANTGTGSQPAALASSSCTVASDWPVYTVVAGDTLGRIAQLGSTTIENLRTANCLENIDSLAVGQQIRVPMSLDYVLDKTTNLRRVGDFMGAPDLSGCWASGNGKQALVYDAIGGTAFAILINRIPIISATDTGWISVDVFGTKTIADTTGWMKTSEVSVLGACPDAPGLQSISFKGQPMGNPAGVPDGVCAVVSRDPGSSAVISVYDSVGVSARIVGVMIGWGRWLSTEGSFYQAEFQMDGGVMVPGWVDLHYTELVNC